MRWLTCCGLGLLTACASVVPTDEDGTESTSSADETTGGRPGGGPTQGRPTTGRPPTGPPTASGSVGGDPTSVGTTWVDPTPGDETSIGPDPGVLDFNVDETTGPLPELLCLPPGLHGPAIESHRNGWTAFEGCVEDELILQTSGEPPLITQDQIDPVYAQYGQSLLGLPGAYTQFVTPCCVSPEELCLGVLAEPSDFDIGEGLAYLNELFAVLPEGCVGVKVVLQEP